MRTRRILLLVRSSIGFIFALILGATFVFGGLRGYPFAMDSLAGGITAILGALAFRSLKQRWLGLRPNTGIRRGMEIVAFAIVLAPLAILATEGNDALQFYPLSGILVPAAMLAAFLWLFLRRKAGNGDPMRLIR